MLEQKQLPIRSYDIYDRAEIESNFQHVSTFGVEQEDNITGKFTGGIYSRTFLLTNVEYEFVFEKEKPIMLSIKFKGLHKEPVIFTQNARTFTHNDWDGND